MVQNFPILLRLLFLLGDCLLTVVCVYVSLNLVLYFYPIPFSTEVYYKLLPINIILIEIFFNIYGLFSLYKKRFSEIFIGVTLSVFYVFIVMMAISFFMREFSYSRSVLSLTLFFEFILFNFFRYFIYKIERLILNKQHILIIGGNEEDNKVKKRLLQSDHLKYKLTIINPSETDDWKQKMNTNDVIIICSDINKKIKEEIVNISQQLNRRVLLQPSIYELYFNELDFEKIDDIPFFAPQYLDITLEQKTLKRIFDILFSTIVLIALFFPMIFIAILIKMDSKGPIFYKQKRVGRYGKEFYVYKFRSMKNDAEKLTGPVFAGKNDKRITKVGNFLRRTRLDELPQFINVLKGDMSTVGPRPERPFFVEQFAKQMPEYVYRHNVKPGITGMAQVYGKYNTTVYDKLIYDLLYIQKCNLFTDFVIIVQTVRVLFQKSSTEGV